MMAAAHPSAGQQEERTPSRVRAPYLQAMSVSKAYRKGRDLVPVLDDVSLRIDRGEFVAIVGPSGCGKSTLMRCLSGLEPATQGRVHIAGKEIVRPIQEMGFVFQKDLLLEWRTVLDNVLFNIELRGLRKRDFRDEARALLRTFGIDDYEQAYPRQLSGGMRMRVAICRALLGSPPLLFMDEPFAALDAFTRDELNLELQQLTRVGATTTVFITHSIPEAIFLADTIVILDRNPGRIADIIQVDFPRPRTLSLREAPEFVAVVSRIRSTFERIGVYRPSPELRSERT